MTRPTRLRLPLLALSLALSLAACGGGGGGTTLGGGPGPDPEPDGGDSYAASAFDYESPYPVDFHPLGGVSKLLDRSSELIVAATHDSASTVAGVALDLHEGAAPTQIGGLEFALQSDSAFFALERGNLDSDGAEELVVLQDQGGGMRIAVVEEGAAGGLTLVDSLSIALSKADDLALGDVDGDHRDEVLVAYRQRTWVYDDVESGLAPLGTIDWTYSFDCPTAVTCLDLDVDGRDEVVIGHATDTEDYYCRVVDDAEAGFATLLSNFRLADEYSFAFGVESRSELLAADLDGDRREELVLAWATSSNFDLTHYYVAGHRWDGTFHRTCRLETDYSGGAFDDSGLTTWGIAARANATTGTDTLALLLPHDSSGFSLLRYQYSELVKSGASFQDVDHYIVPGYHDDDFAPAVATGDVDADGQEEVFLTLLRDVGSRVEADVRLVLDGPSDDVSIGKYELNLLVDSGRPLLVLADLDGDGYLVRSTDVRTTQLADPIPLVVMTAVPTKAGVEQNMSSSQTSYEESTTNGTSIGVTTETTVSGSASVGGGIGWFGASATREIESSLRTSRVETSSVTHVTGFHAGPETDTIIFQGTLYESFEYRIVSGPDPDRVGELFTIDIPASAKTYKWTVDKFNATFPEHRLGSDVLPHTVGDPASYRSRTEVEALLAENVGWIVPSAKNVGEGTGSIATGIDLAEEATTEQERSYTVTDTVGFSVGPVSGSVSSGISSSSLFSVSTAETTSYGGEVGDLLGEDWDRWQYDFGMAVYTAGLPAGGDAPTTVPVQVITFWTVPLGSGY